MHAALQHAGLPTVLTHFRPSTRWDALILSPWPNQPVNVDIARLEDAVLKFSTLGVSVRTSRLEFLLCAIPSYDTRQSSL